MASVRLVSAMGAIRQGTPLELPHSRAGREGERAQLKPPVVALSFELKTTKSVSSLAFVVVAVVVVF